MLHSKNSNNGEYEITNDDMIRLGQLCLQASCTPSSEDILRLGIELGFLKGLERSELECEKQKQTAEQWVDTEESYCIGWKSGTWHCATTIRNIITLLKFNSRKCKVQQ